MVDLTLAHRVAEELEALALNDPLLVDFLPSLAALVANTKRVLQGDLAIGPLPGPHPSTLPDREAAERIVEVASRMPGPDGTESPELRRALGQLHGNLVEAVMYAVFTSYPDVVRDAQVIPQ